MSDAVSNAAYEVLVILTTSKRLSDPCSSGRLGVAAAVVKVSSSHSCHGASYCGGRLDIAAAVVRVARGHSRHGVTHSGGRLGIAGAVTRVARRNYLVGGEEFHRRRWLECRRRAGVMSNPPPHLPSNSVHESTARRMLA